MDRKWVAALCAAMLALGSPGDAAELDLAAPESDARVLAIAGAGTATAAGAGAVWWNVAGLADTPRAALLLAHVALRPSLEQQSGVLAVRPFADRSWVVAVQADVLREPGIPVDDVLSGSRPASPRAGYRAALQAAGEVGRGFAVGAGLGRTRGLPGSAEPDPALVADLGLLWRHAGTRAALALRGGRLTGGSGRAPVLAVATSQAVLRSALVGTAELDRDPIGDLHPAGGLEWHALPALALRAGARYENAAHGTAATAGLGLGHERIHLDYAVRLLTGEPAVHALAFGIDFGDPPPVPGALAPAGEDRAPALPAREPGAPSPAKAPAPRPAAAPPRAVPPATVPAPSAPEAPPRAVPPATVPAPSAPEAPPRAVPPATPPSTRRAPDARAPRAPSPVSERFAVVAGPYSSLEEAAAAIFALRQIQLSPGVQSEGERFFVVAQRGLERADAETLRARAARAGVACKLVPQ